MPKKPRMPKSGRPATPPPDSDTTEDDIVITDAPAPVTKISRKTTTQGKRAKPPVEPTPAEPAPAPRSKMRERLLASAKRTTQRPKQTGVKRLDRDIWDRDDRAVTFENDPQPARHFSGRTVALLTVLFIAALIMAQPLQLLLEQQADITQAQQQLTQARDREENLETQLERWQDPAYVQQQARERFNMVMPGERRYLVVNGPDDTDDAASHGVPHDENLEMGWADRLWGSVLTSGQEKG